MKDCKFYMEIPQRDQHYQQENDWGGLLARFGSHCKVGKEITWVF